MKCCKSKPPEKDAVFEHWSRMDDVASKDVPTETTMAVNNEKYDQVQPLEMQAF